MGSHWQEPSQKSLTISLNCAYPQKTCTMHPWVLSSWSKLVSQNFHFASLIFRNVRTTHKIIAPTHGTLLIKFKDHIRSLEHKWHSTKID